MTDDDRKARVQARLDDVIENGTVTQFIEVLPYLKARLVPVAMKEDKAAGFGTVVFHYDVDENGQTTPRDPLPGDVEGPS